MAGPQNVIYVAFSHGSAILLLGINPPNLKKALEGTPVQHHSQQPNGLGALNRKEILARAMAWTNLEDIILRS